MKLEVQASDLEGLGSFEIVDIRTLKEVAKEPLQCDHRHIPMDQLLNQPDQLKKEDAYVLVCAAGIRTRFAAQALRQLGFEKVYSLVGGNQVL